ncbi:MAG TPA: histidine kinase, partial [Rhodospirillum rubrum]|nr:histidine kinase [Rhodospirillum rubrum]
MSIDTSYSSTSMTDYALIRAQLFQKTDTDSSGGVSLEELTAKGQTLPTGKNSQSTEDLFKQVDTDSSGEISLEELENFASASLASQTSGSLLQAQEETATTPATLKELFNTLDSDDDNTISLEEFEAGASTAQATCLLYTS